MGNLQGIIAQSVNNAKVQMERLGVISGAAANYTTDAYKTPRFDTYMLADGRLAGVERYDYSQGSIYKTNRELDLAIDGMGFVPVTTKEGKVAYTRSLSMTTTNEGLLVTPDGSVVAGGIKVPTDSWPKILMRFSFKPLKIVLMPNIRTDMPIIGKMQNGKITKENPSCAIMVKIAKVGTPANIKPQTIIINPTIILTPLIKFHYICFFCFIQLNFALFLFYIVKYICILIKLFIYHL